MTMIIIHIKQKAKVSELRSLYSLQGRQEGGCDACYNMILFYMCFEKKTENAE
jgi:hypothetical protein